MRKLLYFLSTFAILYTGCSWYFGYKTHEFYQNLPANVLEAELLGFEAGIFTSTAYFQMNSWQSKLAPNQVIQAKIEHGPFPWSDLSTGNFTPRLARISQIGVNPQDLTTETQHVRETALEHAPETLFAQLTWLNLDFSRQIKARTAQIEHNNKLALASSRLKIKWAASQTLQELNIDIPYLELSAQQHLLRLQNLQISYKPLHNQQQLIFIQADEVTFAGWRFDHFSASFMLKPHQNQIFGLDLDLLVSDIAAGENGIGTFELKARLDALPVLLLEPSWLLNNINIDQLWRQLIQHNPTVDIVKLRLTNRAQQIYSQLQGHMLLAELPLLAQHRLQQQTPNKLQLSLDWSLTTVQDISQALAVEMDLTAYANSIQSMIKAGLIQSPEQGKFQIEITVNNGNLAINGHHLSQEQLTQIFKTSMNLAQ